MTTFIRAAEIWRPDADGHLLEIGSGLYGHAPAFGALSRSMCFGRGEGLPGRVWDEGRPVVLRDLQGGYFQRAAAARSAGLTCAVAFPVFFETLLKAVVVLFCGDGADRSGAIELWHAADADGGLRLVDGVYGPGEAGFEAVSRELRLAPGEGLPSQAFERGRSVFVDGLADSPAFARGAAAAATGLRRGVAFPCPVPGAEPYVLALLSSAATPIASRIDCWIAAAADPRSLERACGFDERVGALPTGEIAGAEVDPAVLTAFATGVPAAGADGAAPLLALPIVRDGAVVEAVVLTF